MDKTQPQIKTTSTIQMHKGSAIWLKYSSPNRSKKQQEPHKRAYLSVNGGLGKKKSGEWAKRIIKTKRIRQKEQQD